MDQFRHNTSDLSRLQKPPPPRFSQAKNVDEWEVEKIMKHCRSKMSDLEYEVKWTGYDETTWDPVEYPKARSNKFLYRYHTENNLWLHKWMRKT
jgi:hypothetical protein